VLTVGQGLVESALPERGGPKPTVVCPCGQRLQLRLTLDTPIRSLEEVAVPRRTPDLPPPKLSPIEVAILGMAAVGETDEAMAKRLKLSVWSVKRAMRSALLRLSARNRTEAVVRAIQAGIVPV
jgi:DNA-binding NarL/FixJ family response regulator